VVVMGGLVTSTALTLLVLPAIYVALARRPAA
jgi:Cu/Ag efflux pump CusA